MKKIEWIVIHGEKLWRKLGFPTANIAYDSGDISNSVFHINIIINDIVYKWMWSHMVWKKIFEAHIFDFDADIYGENIEVILLKKIRDNRKFNSLDELIAQINSDQKLIKSQKINILTFGSFDHIHQGHGYYLWQAKKYWNHLITIVASDENISKIKKQIPKYTLEERMKSLKELWISDEVLAGSNTHPMQWIQQYKPHSICLWYDQRWPFVDALESEIEKLWLDTEVIRISSHHPEKFKSSLLKTKKK